MKFGRMASRTYECLTDLVGYQTYYEQMFRSMRPLTGKVLDVGCGHGPLSLAAHAVFGADIELYGLDSSEEMLERASVRANAAGVPYTLLHGDANSIASAKLWSVSSRAVPVAVSEFSAVISAGLLEYAGVRAVREFLDVLEPRGTLLCCIVRDNALGRISSLAWDMTLVHQQDIEKLTGLSFTDVFVRTKNMYLRTLKHPLVAYT